MIARLLSFNHIGSYKNPIWHIGATSEVVTESTPMPPFNELTIIPFETINNERLNQIEKLDHYSKNHVIIQFSVHEILGLNRLIGKNIKAQLWVDQPLSSQDLEVLIKYQSFIEIIMIPMSQFNCMGEAEKILETRSFSCGLLLIPKKSIHDPFPTPDNYYYWLDELKKKNKTINKVILKSHFEESSLPLQNLFLNYNRQNILEYIKSKSSAHFAAVTFSQAFNLFSLNYFSNILLSLLKPHKPIIFRVIYYDIRQFILFVKNLFLQSEWRVRKAIWLLVVRFYYSILLKTYYSFLLKIYYSFLLKNYYSFKRLYSMTIHYYCPLMYHKLYMFILFMAWPIRKVYWVARFQYKKRILGHHNNEL